MNIGNITATPPSINTSNGEPLIVNISYNAQLEITDLNGNVSIKLSISNDNNIFILDDADVEVNSYSWTETYNNNDQTYNKAIRFRVRNAQQNETLCGLDCDITNAFGFITPRPFHISYK